MKVSLLIALLAAWVLVAGDGARHGRSGNAHYDAGRYAEAAAAYRAGLDARGGAGGTLPAALRHNLGLALFRDAQHEEAAAAFAQARAAAGSPQAFARAAYNAGLNAAAADDPQAALALFRAALLADPAHEDARYNYELLMRNQPEEQPQSERPPPPIEPSAYARQVKQQAEALVARQRYAEAGALLQEALRQDSTVRAYQPFIQRVRDVAMIDTSRAPLLP